MSRLPGPPSNRSQPELEQEPQEPQQQQRRNLIGRNSDSPNACPLVLGIELVHKSRKAASQRVCFYCTGMRVLLARALVSGASL
jgi:hypothetical protein